MHKAAGKFTSELSACLQGGGQMHRCGVSCFGARARARLCMCVGVDRAAGGSPVCAAERFCTQHFSPHELHFQSTQRRRGVSLAGKQRRKTVQREHHLWGGCYHREKKKKLEEVTFLTVAPPLLSPPQDSISVHFINASLTLIMVSSN